MIDGEGYSSGASTVGRQQLVTAMDTSPGGGIMRGGIYHPSAVPNMSEAQVSTVSASYLFFLIYFLLFLLILCSTLNTSLNITSSVIGSFQVRPGRTLQRPLGRTHSSPLPLGHPMLAATPPTFLPHGPPSAHQYDPKHAIEHHQHNLLKQVR